MLPLLALPWALLCAAVALSPAASGQAAPAGRGPQLAGAPRAGSAHSPGALEVIAQTAYLKASNTGAGDGFGGAVALSGDTLVVAAGFEDSSAVGVEGNQADDGALDSGAAYVFVRDGASWSQQAYLKPSNTGALDQFGASLAISGDTIVVGAPREDSSATGVDGVVDELAADSGAAYVFVRDVDTWSQQAWLKASNTGAGDRFGQSVTVDGDSVVVGAPDEDGAASGIGGAQGNNAAANAGAAYVFVRAGTTWSQQAYVKASNTGAGDAFGGAVSLSGDTLVCGAIAEDSSAVGVGGDQASNAASGSGAAYVLVRAGATWSQQAYLKASNTGADDHFGGAVAVSGELLAVGAHSEDSSATNVDGNQASNAAPASGAAYVFGRSGSAWSQQAYLKASNTGAGDEFGIDVAISGNDVVVGAPHEDGDSELLPSAGAAYHYARLGTSWSAQVFLNASNTGAIDRFGSAVTVSDGLVVVGAWQEDGSATGVGGDRDDEGAPDAGAAYAWSDPDAEPWTDLGGGTSGSSGPPLLALSGPLTPSSLLTLELVDGAPSALAVLFISFTSTPAAFLGGTLHAFPLGELFVLGTDGSGGMFGAVLFPAAPAGQGLWFQVGIADGAVPIYGASLSNGVVGIVP